VLDRLVRNAELAKVVADHLGLIPLAREEKFWVYLDLNLVEGLAVVHTDVAANHLRNNDHVAEVGLDNSGLLLRENVRQASMMVAIRCRGSPSWPCGDA
jgi:hypothetical protein